MYVHVDNVYNFFSQDLQNDFVAFLIGIIGFKENAFYAVAIYR